MAVIFIQYNVSSVFIYISSCQLICYTQRQLFYSNVYHYSRFPSASPSRAAVGSEGSGTGGVIAPRRPCGNDYYEPPHGSYDRSRSRTRYRSPPPPFVVIAPVPARCGAVHTIGITSLRNNGERGVVHVTDRIQHPNDFLRCLRPVLP